MPQQPSQEEVDRALRRLGKNIRHARVEHDIALDTLARNAGGMERSHLGKIEAGGHNPSLKTLMRIAAALDMPVRDLLVGDGFD